MKPAAMKPRVQLFVCTNNRDANDPLKSGCGAHGPGVYQAMKREVARRGRVVDVWVTRTLCLGQCPPEGCSVSLEPSREQWVEVREGDVTTLLDRALGTTRSSG
jgi:predicted metal-binding protein